MPGRKQDSVGKVQAGLEPADWKPFDEVGAGAREIRIREASGTSRVMYVAKFEEAIYVLHCFQKKTQVTSKQDRAIARGPLSRRGQREKGKEMKIETETRHVTKPGANLFLELG